jgi:hypothetical protein
LPEVNELARAGGSVRLGVVETVNADLQQAIALHVMGLERAGDELPPYIATADILLDAFREVLFAKGNATLIVIELDIACKEGAEFLEIAAVIGIEKGRVKRCRHLIQFRLRFKAVQRLSIRYAYKQCEQR